MGLDISTKSGKSYHYGYSALHSVRSLAAATQGVAPFVPAGTDKERFPWSVVVTHAVFPNLMCHSDCQGSYTMTGRVGDAQLLNGNLPGLVDELRLLKRLSRQIKEGELVPDKKWAVQVLNSLLAVAEDALKHEEPLNFR